MSRAVDLPRLLFRAGPGVDFRALLAVLDQHVQAERGHETGLAILARNLHVGFPEAAQAVLGPLPAEERGKDELLPRLKLQREPLARPLALDVGHQLLELDHPLGHSAVEEVRRAVHPVPPGQIVKLALAGEHRPLARRNAPGDHIAGVAERGFNVGIDLFLRHALLPTGPRSPFSHPSSSVRPRGCGCSGTCRTRSNTCASVPATCWRCPPAGFESHCHLR